MPWLALTLEVEAAAAEAMSDALLDAGAQSVAVEGKKLSALMGQGEDATLVVANASRAAGIPSPRFSVETLDDQDWVRASQAQFSPLEIGRRLWIGATWHEAPRGRAAVRIDPGLAFGTGSHPTTKLMLGLLEKLIRGGERVLDYGCGSGILAITAARLGATHVDAVDVDPVAVETAAANARANAVAVRAVLADALPPAGYDLVLANILAQPLIVLAPLLIERVAPGGRLALAGLLHSQVEEVAQPYREALDLEVTAAAQGWALLEGVRR